MAATHARASMHARMHSGLTARIHRRQCQGTQDAISSLARWIYLRARCPLCTLVAAMRARCAPWWRPYRLWSTWL